MPHIFEKTETLNYSWGMVTAANWIKYPNPITNHVLSVDILSREVDPETGVLRTERLLCCKQSAPAILRTLGLPIPEVAWFREVSELDPVSQEYTARTVNLTMRNLMIVKETCVYKAVSELIDEGEKLVKEKLEAVVEAAPSPRGFFDSFLNRPLFGGSASSTTTTPIDTSASTSVEASHTHSSNSGPSTISSHSAHGSSTSLPVSATPSSHVSDDTSLFARFKNPFSSVATPASDLEGTNQSTNPPQQQLTQFIQTAEFHAQIGISSVRNLMEEAARNRFQMNAGKGLRALESVIVRLLDESKEAVANVDG
ncbi:hypothetical protein CcCBS67573_g07892 [Chytriomyces confervae]|uniref:PRELI/MSF1 domain-containing protein n=1 Tax=Chytriomyces confervae TaxID=246404 RepID=A0A507EQX0_9FUNG|nr:hypothetical protein HDU80_000934 [Chytriomyces hyalinus]TPX66232.1 hypothetical protein CcCBS67573_g07892 [Chytriomyces confervae]